MIRWFTSMIQKYSCAREKSQAYFFSYFSQKSVYDISVFPEIKFASWRQNSSQSPIHYHNYSLHIRRKNSYSCCLNNIALRFGRHMKNIPIIPILYILKRNCQNVHRCCQCEIPCRKGWKWNSLLETRSPHS